MAEQRTSLFRSSYSNEPLSTTRATPNVQHHAPHITSSIKSRPPPFTLIQFIMATNYDSFLAYRPPLLDYFVALYLLIGKRPRIKTNVEPQLQKHPRITVSTSLKGREYDLQDRKKRIKRNGNKKSKSRDKPERGSTVHVQGILCKVLMNLWRSWSIPLEEE